MRLGLGAARDLPPDIPIASPEPASISREPDTASPSALGGEAGRGNALLLACLTLFLVKSL
jgi:hypothetical protein